MNPLLKKLANTEIILGSGSPRRAQLLTEIGVPFKVIVKNVDETPPEQFRREDTAMFLARKKALAFKPDLGENMLVITADTIVAMDEFILGKPADAAEATRMLQLLSGRKHQVITGVCILSLQKSESFFVKTEVSFKTLRPEEISYYVETYQPFDKAGAYGIQEWIGMTGIDYIQGSYFNVMGLPLKELYEQLLRF
jgi:septum formation protein